MADDRHILQQGNESSASHAFRDWLRRQLFGDTGISLDRSSLIFGLLFFFSVAVAAIGAVILGFGTAAILAALSVWFVLTAAIGGPLRSDLQMMAWFGPIFILAVGGVHFLAIASPWGAIPVIVVIVFIAGLLPAFSPRYTTVSLALVLGVLIGFGLQLPNNLPVIHIFGAIAVGIAVIVLMQLILGWRDPSLITRQAIARVLTDTDMGAIDTAWKTLRAVHARQWMSEALSGAEAYCVARLILTTRLEQLSQADALRARSILDQTDQEARELVGLIEAKKAPPAPVPTQRTEEVSAGELAGDLQNVVASLWQSLERVRLAALRRDRTPASISKLPGTSFSDTSRALVSWDSIILRQALRSALVVLIALVIVSLNWGNPLNATFLATTFVIIQPTWQDTAANALQQIAAAIFGVGITAGLALIVPPAVLLPLALFALILAFPFMLKNKTISTALVAIMTLLLVIATKSLPASTGLLEYLLYIVVAAMIALLFILVVPRVEPNAVKRTQKAMAAVRGLLLSVSSALSNAQGSTSRIRDDAILAARAIQNVHATPTQLRKASKQSRELTVQVATALEKLLADVSALEFHPVDQRNLATELSAAEQLLNLDNAVDSEHVMAAVRRSTNSENPWQQNWLVAHALAAHHAAKQLLALERVANGSR